jgi:hypothetical protein
MTIREKQLHRLLRRLRAMDVDSAQRDRLIDRVKGRLFGDRCLVPAGREAWARAMYL